MKRAAVLAALFLAFAVTVDSYGATNVSGNITANTTWTLAGSPYILSGDISVGGSASPTLTIEAGVVVKGNANAHLLINFYNKGALVTNGTETDPVVFTANGSTSAAYWQGIHFGVIAGGPASALTWTTIEYAGSTQNAVGALTVRAFSPSFDHVTSRVNQFAGIKVEGGTPSITNSTLRDNVGSGLYTTGGNPTITGVALLSNSGYAISAHPNSQLDGLTGLTATGNGTNAIEFRGADMTVSRTWRTCTLPYVVTGSIHVKAATAPILTIEAGNTIRFNANTQIAVNWENKGGLAANGTAAAPILFTSNAASPTPGAWWGLFFGDIAGNTPSTLSYATIEYGGYAAAQRGGVTIYNVSPVFDHVTIRNSAHAGATLHGGGATFTDSTLTGNSGPGIYTLNTSTLGLTNTALTNNNGYAVSAHVATTFTSTTGITASGNGTGRDAIEMRGGDVGVSRTWTTSPLPYVVAASIHVKASTAPILTIQPGNTIRFANNSQIAVNWSDKGGLSANGTAAAPILFTSNAATPTPGSWWGLYFGEVGGNTPSSVSHATIEYGGYPAAQRGGVTIHAVTPVFSNVTIRNSAWAGVAIHGAGVSLADSTITATAGPGIYASNTATLTLANTAFTNNNGYAVSAPAPSTFHNMSGLSASGNGTGRDGIELRQGVLTTNRTWPASAIPWIVSGNVDVQGSAAPILTIAAGNTIRFNSGAQLTVNHGDRGGLQAIGTPSAPITFTTNGTQTPGYWLGLWFGPIANPPQSNVAWAIVEYGGNSVRGGITVNAGSPVFDHLVLRQNTNAGFIALGSSSPRITNTYFHSNPAGVKATSPATVIARLNYWNAAAGPCTPGSCASGQQSVSSATKYEPWLTGLPTDPQFVTDAVQKNRIFNPTIGSQTILNYATALSGDVTVTVRDSANTVVRTFTGSGTPGTFQWDGKNESAVIQPDGTYTFELASTAASQPPAAIARGLAIVDSTRLLSLSNPTVSQTWFSPNGDSVKDTVTVSATTNYEDATWTVSVLNAASNVVRTQNGTGATVSYAWDGRNATNVVQPDGLYTLRIDAVEGEDEIQGSASTTLDNTPPAASIVNPLANKVFSNVYSNGVTNYTITGNVSDVHLEHWVLDLGAGSAPTGWNPIGSGDDPVTNGYLGMWQSWFDPNGAYALRIFAKDRAGNVTFTTALPITLGHFKVSQSAFQFNVTSGQSVTYTSTVPFPLTETIVLKNEAGAVVRNLVSTARNAGSYTDTFNGLDDAGVLLPDGPYFYVATVTEGASTFTWDLSNDFRYDFGDFNDNLNIQPYDPFNNKPMKFNYNFVLPGRVNIAMTTTPGVVDGNCANPTATFFCPVINRWEESGPHTFVWSGIDHTGAYRVTRSVGIVTVTDKWAKNAALLYGTKPKVENVKVTPPVLGPAVGTQAIEFDLTTYQSAPVDVSIALVNLSTISTLRTLTATGQTPGHVTVPWDGRADNGMYVAPGYYRVLVTVTDARGNVVQGDILTTIQY
jgi:flagellar hook assembly protein FlgD